MFYAENNPESKTSHSDTGVQSFSDNEDDTDTCVVCGTFDKVSKLQVLERGSGGKMNVTELISLCSLVTGGNLKVQKIFQFAKKIKKHF